MPQKRRNRWGTERFRSQSPTQSTGCGGGLLAPTKHWRACTAEEVTRVSRPAILLLASNIEGGTNARGVYMSHYKSNLRDVEFNLFEVLGRQELLGTGPFAEVDEETARDMLAEANRLALGPVAESFVDSDRNPPVFD